MRVNLRIGLVICVAFNLSSCKILPFDSLNAEKKDQQLLGTENSTAQMPLLLELAEAQLKIATKPELVSCKEKIGLNKEIDALADPTNFGERMKTDVWNRKLQSKPMVIVIHETVMSENATVSFFQTPHYNDANQASYHMLITRSGQRLRIVPDENRAYGAGMSAFGDVTQRAKKNSLGSINNISLHISLVSPEDGRDNRSSHSGYTAEQYKMLATQTLLWQAKFGIPLTRVTTHEAVDRSHSRYDPRSFRWEYFDTEYKKTANICDLERFNNDEASI